MYPRNFVKRAKIVVRGIFPIVLSGKDVYNGPKRGTFVYVPLTVEEPAFMLMITLMITICVILVLVSIIIREENHVFGHAQSHLKAFASPAAAA